MIDIGSIIFFCIIIIVFVAILVCFCRMTFHYEKKNSEKKTENNELPYDYQTI